MVTPFDHAGEFDPKAAAQLAVWLVEQGNQGLVLAGTTGESPTITDDERLELFRVVREAVDVPLLAGATTNDTAHSVGLVEACAAIGMDGILAVTPYYNKPSQAGLDAHFRAIAAATPLPVVLYDVPGRSVRKIATETMLRLAHEVPNIVALKDASGDPAETSRLIAEAPDGFEVYSGDEPLTPALLAYGAVGVIGVASHWTAPEQVQLFRAWDARDIGRVQAIHRQLQASFDYMNSETCVFSQSAKAALRVLGL